MLLTSVPFQSMGFHPTFFILTMPNISYYVGHMETCLILKFSLYASVTNLDCFIVLVQSDICEHYSSFIVYFGA